MRLLVTGAAGQVGTELLKLGPEQGAEVDGRRRAELDICDRDAVAAALGAARYDLLVNAAAYTAVDKAQFERAEAMAGNCEGPSVLAEAAAAAEVPILHISTDYVFGGDKKGFYKEEDPVAPLGEYGISKEAGERAVRDAAAQHIIMRTAWVYAAHGSNFLKTMLRVGAERDTLNIVDDQLGTPTAASDIARAILDIAKRIKADRENGAATPWGTYHYTAEGDTSWFGFAKEIFKQARGRIDKEPRLSPIPSHMYPAAAPRPANSRLDCGLIVDRFSPFRRPWQDGVREVLDDLLSA